jgi:transposase
MARREQSPTKAEYICADQPAYFTFRLQKSGGPYICSGAHNTLSLWSKITVFLKQPELELSNNLAENSMRPVAIGRRNWLHLGSKEAAPKIAAIFSVIESCRRLNIPIRRYLGDILPGLANRSIQSLAELTPATYAAKSTN